MDQQNESLIHSLSFNSKGKLIWLASFGALQSFVEEVLCLTSGKWLSPGGDAKLYQDQDLSIRWYTRSKTLTVSEGKSRQIESKLNSLASISKNFAKTPDVSSDAGVVQSQVSSMFNSADDSSEADDATVCVDESDISTSFGTPILSASQSQRRCEAFDFMGLADEQCLNRVAFIETEFLKYKGKTSQDISNILAQLSYSENVIKKQQLELQQQGEEIIKLKSANLRLHEILNELKSKICQLEPLNIIENNEEIKSSNDITNKSQCAVNEMVFSYAKLSGSASTKENNNTVSSANNSPLVSSSGISSISKEIIQRENTIPSDRALIKDNAENSIPNNKNIVRETECTNSTVNVCCDSQASSNLQNPNDTSRSPKSRSPHLIPKHLVPCPFLKRRGSCLKGSKCDFKHRDFQHSVNEQQLKNGQPSIPPFPHLLPHTWGYPPPPDTYLSPPMRFPIGSSPPRLDNLFPPFPFSPHPFLLPPHPPPLHPLFPLYPQPLMSTLTRPPTRSRTNF